MVVLMDYVHLDPSDINDFIADIQAITPETRAKDGCLFYAVAVNDAGTGRLLVAERWQNQDSLAAYIRTQ